MDKFYLAKFVARDRKNEIDRELAVRHMLKEANWKIFKVSKTMRLVMRFALVVIIISILALFILL